MDAHTSEVAQRFRQRFGRAPDVCVDAPGRVNLIGEHTDYNGGFVLPIAIPQRCSVALARRGDAVVRAASTALAVGSGMFEYRLGGEGRGSVWTDYLQGCTRELGRTGQRLRGFDVLVHSEVPVGAGLSSSAALEVSLLRALRHAFELELDDVALALVRGAAMASRDR